MANDGDDERHLSRTGREVGLALVLLTLRLFYLQHPWPVHGDEAEFVRAVGFPAQYPVHHPGYPLWVGIGTAFHGLGLSPYASYQFWSVAASVLLPVLMYLGLRRGVRDSLAWWTALAFGVCPLIWFTGVTALNYVAGCTVGWVVVVLSHRALSQGRCRPLVAAGLVMAAGVCLRADLLLTVGPVVVFVAWRLRAVGGFWAMLVVAGGVVLLASATAVIYGRADTRLPAPHLSHTLDVILGTSVFRLGVVDGFVRNAVKLGVNVGWHLGAAVLLLPGALVFSIKTTAPLREMAPPLRRDTRILLLLWWGPTAAFLLLVHMTEPGHMMALLPVAYCLIAIWLNDRFGLQTGRRVMQAVVLFSVVQFVAYPWSLTGAGFKRVLDAKIAYVSGAGLRQIDRRGEIHSPGDYWKTPVHQSKTPKQIEGGGR